MAFRARTFSGAIFWFVDTETEAFKTDPDTRRQARRNPEPKLFYTSRDLQARPLIRDGTASTLGSDHFRPVYCPAEVPRSTPLTQAVEGASGEHGLNPRDTALPPRNRFGLLASRTALEKSF